MPGCIIASRPNRRALVVSMFDTNLVSPVVRCAHVPIAACHPKDAATAVVRQAAEMRHPPGADVHLCNAYTLALADKDPAFAQMLRRAALNLPDGKAVVWANQLQYRSMRLPSARVYGPDLMLDVFEQGQPKRLKHYLLGGTPHVAQLLRQELRRRFPRAVIVGASTPPFRDLGPDEWEREACMIRASGAQLVWVGLGTPKQDWACSALASDTAAVIVAVGAAFDFIAGEQRQAPRWMQRNGLEWLFRLVSEPRRLWRRYLFGNARFVRAVLRAGAE